MAIPLPEKPHTTRIAGGVETIRSSNETMQILSDEGRLWMQRGVVYDEAGVRLDPDNLPVWFMREYDKLTPEMKKRHPLGGSDNPEDPEVAGFKPNPDDPDDLASMTKDELKSMALAEGVELASGDTKADIIRKVYAFRG